MFWRRKKDNLVVTETPTEEATSALDEAAQIVEAVLAEAAAPDTTITEPVVDQAMPTETLADGMTAATPDMAAAAVESVNAPTSPAETTKPRQRGGAAFGMGLVLGVGIGAVVALLFAPKNGEEVRSVLVERGAL